MNQMRILLDMDGVLANFEQRVMDLFRERYPYRPSIPLNQRTTFYVKEQYPKQDQPLLEEICNSRGFYHGIPPIEGAIDAVREMEQKYELFICTSPARTQFCIPEKLEWIERYLGKAFTQRTIITRDKTIIMGNYLIDDKPEIKGVQQPTWEHIIFTQPYNLNVEGKRRLTWQNWKSVLFIP